MMTPEEYELTVVKWVSEWARRPYGRLTPQTCINCGMITGLGVDGEDADELIKYLQDVSGVSFSDFSYDDYFGPELSIAAWIFRPHEIFRGKKLKNLTISDLAAYMYSKVKSLE